MKNKKIKKYFLYAILFLSIVFLTFYTIFYHNDVVDIINNIKNIQLKYILICTSLFILYFVLQGVYVKHNLNILGEKTKLSKDIFYCLAEYFFSAITPSSTGGQPAQLYYMNKDKIPNKKSIITLILDTIYFKIILVLFSLLILIFKHDFVLNISPLFTIFYFLGMAVDLFMIAMGILVLYKKSIVTHMLFAFKKIRKIINKNYELQVRENVVNYNKEVRQLSQHKLGLTYEFLITIIQRMCLFSISYVVYRAFGFNEYNYLEVIIIQISVQTATEFVPIPGGTGASEYLFSVLFITLFGSSLASTAMLVTRTFTFYLPLVLCGIAILIKFIKDKYCIYMR